MHKVLVKLSDKFDQEGKHDLADKADALLSSTASRPKAPLKSLDDDVKKDLLKFVHDVKKNLENSMDSLNEFFRRLRYFDIGDTAKDLKLDKALKEIAKTHECMDAAGKAMYALTHGKHPSKADMEQMADDFGSSDKDSGGPLDFFKSQVEPEEQGAKPGEQDRDRMGEMESLYGEEGSVQLPEGLSETSIEDEDVSDETEADEFDNFMQDFREEEEEGEDVSRDEFDDFMQGLHGEKSFEDESEDELEGDENV